jgi:hypothetical protein
MIDFGNRHVLGNLDCGRRLIVRLDNFDLGNRHTLGNLDYRPGSCYFPPAFSTSSTPSFLFHHSVQFFDFYSPVSSPCHGERETSQFQHIIR